MSRERLHPSSAGKLLDVCPLKWRHWVDKEWMPNRAMVNGSALHSLVLGGAQVVEIEYNDTRTKAAKAARDAALRDGFLPVLSKDLANVVAECKRVEERLYSEHRKEDLAMEKTIQWESEGVLLEGTPDALDMVQRVVIELKRTASIPRFGNVIADSHYDLQAAAYIEAAETRHGGVWSHKFLVAEGGAPFCTRFDYLSPTGVLLGEAKWQRAKEIFNRCAQSGVWSDYEDAIHEPKPWQMSRFGL